MIDRIFLGYVVDFLDFYALGDMWIWVFNVADAFVCVGAGIVALYLIMDIIKDAKKPKENVPQDSEIKEEQQEMIVAEKESFWKKIINKIKKVFGK